MGIEFREGSLLISSKCSAPAKKGRCQVLFLDFVVSGFYCFWILIYLPICAGLEK